MTTKDFVYAAFERAGNSGYPDGVFTMFRRAVFGAAIAAMTAAILRVFGGDGAPPQQGGWREVDPAEFD